jgi:hypothetical protein
MIAEQVFAGQYQQQPVEHLGAHADLQPQTSIGGAATPSSAFCRSRTSA